ncbi:META domain-containing protein [Salinarimonas soli]|uniref:META domain-containing protein n=1 Tax=Salinarimonas soli TaxID=1638099 RepID=A0A5B2VIL0_9HYPH|nr:META domain-containing protein [Salinarimonas soli]KAA2238350.1 META domain-containing protein [Salinarimonas soli]
MKIRVAALLLLAAASSAMAQTQSQPRGPSQLPPSKDGVPQPRQEKTFPVNVSWVAQSLNGRSFPGERPAITLDANLRIKGFGGCNTFSATAYPLREQGLAVGPLALTKRACAGGLGESERSFLVALRTAQKWDVMNNGGTLVIRGQNGELRFERSF